MEQVHGSRIKQIYSKDDLPGNGNPLTGVDGVFFMQELKDIAVGVKVADCMPVYIVWMNSLIGVVHAGWRGIAEKIGEEVIKSIDSRGLNKKEIYFFAGPHICEKCFKVGKEVIKKFPSAVVKSNRLNLYEALKIQLKESGIYPGNIRLIKEKNFCTYENPDYYSHRRGDSQRMIAFAIQR